VDYSSNVRVEFSIHPLRRGFRREHTIIWELEDVGEVHTETEVVWPNNFSRYIGDKAYGPLIADLLGLPVPKSTVFGRNVAPFRFGCETGSSEVWVRTAATCTGSWKIYNDTRVDGSLQVASGIGPRWRKHLLARNPAKCRL